MVPYSHNPPGHTCGLPCCSEELQIQLRVKRNRGPRTCIGIQHVDEILADNFTFRGNNVSKDRSVLENGFFSVQQKKEAQHGTIPKFASVSKGVTKKDDLGQHNFLKGREITLPETKDPDATNKLYLEDFYTGESDDLLDVTSDKDIEYYMTERNPSNPVKGVPYSQKELNAKEADPWEIMLEVKSKTSPSEKTDDTSSSNYYEVLNYPDSIQSSENEKNISESLTLKRVKKFPIAKPLPEVPPKVPLQNLFNHPPLHKDDDEKLADRSFSTFKQNSTSSDKTINKYNTYSSLYSLHSEKRKQENPQHRSLDRSYSGQKWRMDAREIDFQAPNSRNPVAGHDNSESPKHIFENKKIQSPTIKPEFQEPEMPVQEAVVTSSDGSESPKHTFEGKKLQSPTFKRKPDAPSSEAEATSNDGSDSPKHTFEEKKIQSPTFKRKLKDKKKNPFERTERENQDFNIMLNSELLKLKKFFTQDDDDDTASQRSGQSRTNPAFGKDGRPIIKDSPVTLIL